MVISRLEHIVYTLFHLLITGPILFVMGVAISGVIFGLWMKIEENYGINILKEVAHHQQLVNNAKKLSDIQDENEETKKYIAQSWQKINKRRHQLQEKERELNDKSIDLSAKVGQFERNYKVANYESEEKLTERICKVIGKLPSSNSYSKKMRPYLALTQADVGGSYVINENVRRILEDELKSNEYKAVLMKVYDNLIGYHHNPILVSWIIWSQFKK